MPPAQIFSPRPNDAPARLQRQRVRVGVQRTRGMAQQRAFDPRRGLAGRRSDARRDFAAARRGRERIVRIRQPHVDLRGVQAQLLGHGLCDHGTRAGARLGRTGQRDHAAVPVELDFHLRAGRVHAVPHAVGHADAALDRPVRGAGHGVAALLPADPFRTDPQFVRAPRRARATVPQPEFHGVLPQPQTQHVDGDFQGERALRMPGRPEGARRAGVHQHVVVGRAHVGAVVDAVERSGRAPAEAGARGPVVGQLYPGERTVAHPRHAHLHSVLGPVAAGQVLVLARQGDLDRPARLFRQMGGQSRVRQAGAFGSEVAADETVDHAHPGVGQVEIIG